MCRWVSSDAQRFLFVGMRALIMSNRPCVMRLDEPFPFVEVEKGAKLPFLPSALLHMAIGDAERVRRMKGYRLTINSNWLAVQDNGDCDLCLAGAIIISNTSVDYGRSVSPCLFDNRSDRRLCLIDRVREGGNLIRIITGYFRSEQVTFNANQRANINKCRFPTIETPRWYCGNGRWRCYFTELKNLANSLQKLGF